MKKLISVFIAILTCWSIYAGDGKFDGYKGIIMYPLEYPNTDKDGNITSTTRDRYTIEEYICGRMTKMGMPCYTEDNLSEDFDEDYSQNQAAYLFLDLSHNAGNGDMLKVSISFYNCNHKNVYTVTKSVALNSSEFATFRGRLIAGIDLCLGDVKRELKKHAFDASKSPKPNYPKANISNKSCRTYLDSVKTDNIEGIYKAISSKYKLYIVKNEDFGYDVYYLGDKYLLWHEGDMKGKLEPTAVVDVYSGSWLPRVKSTPWDVFATYNEGFVTFTFGENNEEKYVKLYPNLNLSRKPNDNSTPKDLDKLKLAGTGSGFLMDNQGIIGTNNHVISDASAIKVIFTDGVEQIEYNAKVLLSDKENDVALLQITDTSYTGISTPYAFKTQADVGEDVFTIGFPLTSSMGENYKVTNGIISATTGIEDDVRNYQITVPIQPGNSGGALFNSKGYVVGLTTATLNEAYVKRKIENVNYAVKISYLLSLYQMLPKRGSLTESPEEIPELSKKVKTYKDFVCLIKVFK